MIDYIIISSDENPIYKDFYPIVAEQWYKLGFKTYYILICDIDDIQINEFGIIHKIKKIESFSTSFQSQVVRLFASNLLENSNILTSDIDMLPINKSYFVNHAIDLLDDNIIIYSGQPYRDVPYYPMCYVLSNTNTLRTVLGINGLTFKDYCEMLYGIYGEKWNTDENFMYDKFQLHSEKLIIKNRDYRTRIDRSNWIYNENKLISGYYVDSHLLRPFNEHKIEIEKLISWTRMQPI